MHASFLTGSRKRPARRTWRCSVKADSDFQILGRLKSQVSIIFDGNAVQVRQGGNLAAELLAAGITTFRRTPKSGAQRGPFCMMGACYDCLVSIDGIVRQSCMLTAEDGLVVERAGPGAGTDE
ncbi:(2Fe-2S)-binding protein [Aestuariibius insulae]|uniref:(2Fe-2S)-binding protein n=1 Tax=Aestuariibius insulae TaxID=2058287 RepID=UPI00345EDEC9